MKRHEVWTAAGGSGYAGKPRPVVVLQNERIGRGESITTCGFTSDTHHVEDLRPLVKADPANGLLVDSRIMIDKITTFSRACMGRRIGRLSARDSAALDRAILLFLGLSP